MEHIWTAQEVASMIDHTNLKADAGLEEIKKLCSEAEENAFFSVMVNPVWVEVCSALLEGSEVVVGTVCGFPLGATTVESKIYEARDAIAKGAKEVDYVLNVGKLKDGDHDFIREEMHKITSACHEKNLLVKVIFENCYLSEEQIRAASEIAAEVKPDFIKTSTGFGSYGARTQDVAIMKKYGGGCHIKAAGGIRSWEQCRQMLASGASRIGASSGIEILKQLKG